MKLRCGVDVVYLPSGSPPSRGAWIEISVSHLSRLKPVVAPLAGGVD